MVGGHGPLGVCGDKCLPSARCRVPGAWSGLLCCGRDSSMQHLLRVHGSSTPFFLLLLLSFSYHLEGTGSWSWAKPEGGRWACVPGPGASCRGLCLCHRRCFVRLAAPGQSSSIWKRADVRSQWVFCFRAALGDLVTLVCALGETLVQLRQRER